MPGGYHRACWCSCFANVSVTFADVNASMCTSECIYWWSLGKFVDWTALRLDGQYVIPYHDFYSGQCRYRTTTLSDAIDYDAYSDAGCTSYHSSGSLDLHLIADVTKAGIVTRVYAAIDVVSNTNYAFQFYDPASAYAYRDPIPNAAQCGVGFHASNGGTAVVSCA